MRGAKYELTFKKPSGELVIESGLVMESAQQRITELLAEHYHFQYPLNAYCSYSYKGCCMRNLFEAGEFSAPAENYNRLSKDSPTKSTIYNLSTRPELANKMLSNFVKLKRVIRQPES